MKKTPHWKQPLILGCALALAPLAPVLAQPQPQPEQQQSPAEQKLLAAATQKLDVVKQLIQFDESQIALGNLALQRSHDTRVRALAQNLIATHTQNLDQISGWAKARSLEIRSVGAPHAQGIGGSGAMGTSAAPPQQGATPESPVGQTQPLPNQPTGMTSMGSTLDAYAQRASQHRATLPKDYADLQKETGNSFDRKWLDAVGDTQKKGDDLVKDAADKYTSDTSFAMLLTRTDKQLQGSMQSAKQLEPGLK